jgi:hypothetical protein
MALGAFDDVDRQVAFTALTPKCSTKHDIVCTCGWGRVGGVQQQVVGLAKNSRQAESITHVCAFHMCGALQQASNR